MASGVFETSQCINLLSSTPSVLPSECNKSGTAYVKVNEGFEVLIDELARDAVSTGRQLSTFRKIVMPLFGVKEPYLTLKMKVL